MITKSLSVGGQVRVIGRPFTPSQRQTLWIIEELTIYHAWISRIEARDSRICVNQDSIVEATVLDLLTEI